MSVPTVTPQPAPSADVLEAPTSRPWWLMPRWVFQLRGWIVAPPLIAAFAWPVGPAGGRWPWICLGAGLVLLGFAIRLWAQQHLFYRVKIKKTLATTGPYALVRNPFYIGNALICGGAAASVGPVWLWPAVIAWTFAVYAWVVLYEEDKLRPRYGEAYAQFLASVPRWIPKFAAVDRQSLFTEHFGKAFWKELHCLAVALPCFAKIAYETVGGAG